jgi:hypothetical protein
VIFSRSTISSTFSMSNTGNGYTVMPRIIDAITPALYPKMWKNGFTIR